MPTVIIDQSETAAQVAAMTFAANTTLIVTRDTNTPSGDIVSVDLSSLSSFTNITAITVTNGATAVLGNALVGTTAPTTPALTLNGGIIEVKASTAGTYDAIHVGAAGGLIREDNPGLTIGSVNVPVTFTSGVPTNFEVDFPGLTTVQGSYSASTNTTTLAANLLSIVGREMTITGNPFGITSGATVNFTMSDGNNGVLVCFLPGSRIMTPRGEVPVEHLRVGDEVTTLKAGAQVAQRLVWVGSQTAAPAGDRDAMPIRIKRGALADGVPHADLLVTPEHCLLLNNRLVPARMLVNGRSIVIDESLDNFIVHHIETEPHAIIMANGVATESYLDTGNRVAMQAENSLLLRVPAAAKEWARDAVALLGVERDFVEPLWRAINTRANELGLPNVPSVPTTQDADVALLTATGRRIAPLYVTHDKAVFLLPGTLTEVRLKSRAARPADIVGPFLDDRRMLGLLIGLVSVTGPGWTRVSRTHLLAENLPGWYGLDTTEARWTNGDAMLPLILDASCAALLVEIEVRGGGPYPMTPELPAQQSAIAA